MAKLTREDILKLAQLSRLELADDEIEQLKHEISAVLGYVEQLQNYDLDDTSASYQVTGLRNVTRPDEEINYGTNQEDLLKNAPDIQDDHFKVGRMLT